MFWGHYEDYEFFKDEKSLNVKFGKLFFGTGGKILISSVTNELDNALQLSNEGNTATTKNKGTSSVIATGIGAGSGAGGNQGDYGTTGCLYVLPTTAYCVCKIELPKDYKDAKLTVSVDGDSLSPDGDLILDSAHVETFTVTGDTMFIVKKGAIVNYTLSKEHWVQTGSTSTQITDDKIDSSTNTITIKPTMKKKVFTYTLTPGTKGADIKVTGNLTDNDGNIVGSQSISKNGNSNTFKVWSKEPNINWEESKQYYHTKTGSMSIPGDGQTTLESLEKVKYFVNNSYVSYTHSRNKGLYIWYKKGRLDNDDDSYDNAYTYSTQSATITISQVNNIPNNWIMYLDGCYANTVGDPKLNVSISGVQKISENNMSKNKNNNYTIRGSGNPRNIVIKFQGSKLVTTNFYLDSVYFIVDE